MRRARSLKKKIRNKKRESLNERKMFLFLIFETPRTDNLDLLIRDAHTPSRKYEFDRFLIDSVFFWCSSLSF